MSARPGAEQRGAAGPRPVETLLAASFPWLQAPAAEDLDILARQLGRHPRGTLFVTRRCPHGLPAVILTLPFEGHGGPVPPFLWLSCPQVVKKTAGLESRGFARGIAALLEEGPAAAAFERDERDFGAVLREVALSCGGEKLARRLEGRGVAGGRPGAIKCLHAHTAFALSVEGSAEAPAPERGIAGRMCLEALSEEEGLWCDGPPDACLV